MKKDPTPAQIAKNAETTFRNIETFQKTEAPTTVKEYKSAMLASLWRHFQNVSVSAPKSEKFYEMKLRVERELEEMEAEDKKQSYETGATSHAVNDLILFSDNTRELAELRDNIYKRAITPGDIVYAKYKTLGKNYGFASLCAAFSQLLRETKKAYIKQFPETSDHVAGIEQWDEMGIEFCELYANDFENWKGEQA